MSAEKFQKIKPKSETATLPDNSSCEFSSNVQTSHNKIHSPVSLSSNDLHTFDESFNSSHSSTASASSSPSSSGRYVKERQGSVEHNEQQTVPVIQQRPNVIQMPLHRPIPIKHNTLPLPSPSALPQASYQPIPSPFFRPTQTAPSSLSNLSSLLNDYWRRIATAPIQHNNSGGLWTPESFPQIGTIPQRLNLPNGGRAAADQSLLSTFPATAFQPHHSETSNYNTSLYAMAAALASTQAASVPTGSNELAAQFQAALARQNDPLGLASYQRFLTSEQASTVPSTLENRAASALMTPRPIKSENGGAAKIEPKVRYSNSQFNIFETIFSFGSLMWVEELDTNVVSVQKLLDSYRI